MYIGVDLGSTNIKAAIYDAELKLMDRRSKPVEYIREHGFVEFDTKSYCETLVGLLGQMLKENDIHCIKQIAFTGQAESLVVLDRDGKPLMNAISWMDERSVEECTALAAQFTQAECEAVTGQQAVLPTWPATKILWLKNNQPDIYHKAATYMLLKDYVVYYLTGTMWSDMSIATFSFYFDIYEKCYWKKMLDAIGIGEEKLPPLAEPCTVAGKMKDMFSESLGLDSPPEINIGTLDHFTGMIGTGNIAPGGITLSTGTVMAMTAMAEEPVAKDTGIAMHYGFRPDTHIMLPVVESGGVSLEWFRRTCMPEVSYDEMNKVLAERGRNELLFLPYLVGTNAPEFDADATGVFWGLRQEHDVFDMAHAVMEGVAFVLRKNCEAITAKGTKLTSIIATGGGAKSDIWCQLQADITGLPILIPEEKEAACLGAAMIAAVADGAVASLEAVAKAIRMKKTFTPHYSGAMETKYRRFCALYEMSLELFKK
ncbi:MAG: hypothetical protein IKK03_03190 [Lachnospiraceae bacterium]|nr:hypothetical protein [Lachnospiraceae bacterium]